MQVRASTCRRTFLAAFALGASYAGAPLSGQLQTSLPATAPTSIPAPIAARSLSGPVATRSQRATVTYAAGLLSVRANNSSLNAILREIARVTGMTITGGVADQRVFGEYGPSEPSVVLSTLLDGTGTNLFIRESAENQPAELLLTPRNGGPTPPSPSSPEYNESEEAVSPVAPGTPGPSGPPIFINARPVGPGTSQVPPTATQQAPPLPISGNAAGTSGLPSGPLPIPPPANNVLGDPRTVSPSASTLPVTNSVPTDSIRTPSTAQPVSGIVDSPSGPSSGSTTAGFTAAAQANASSPTTPTNDADTSGSTLAGGSTNSAGSGAAPNGIKTPEQIFEQLQQLRRANQAQQSGTAGSASPSTPQPSPAPAPPQE